MDDPQNQTNKMPLILDLSPTEKTFVVDGSNPVFEGTPFEGVPFRVTVRNLSRTEISEISRRHTKFVRGQQRVDEAAVGIDIFVTAVKSWEGFGDQNGNPLPCTEAIKKQLADSHWSLASGISAAVLDEQARRSVVRTEETKNS